MLRLAHRNIGRVGASEFLRSHVSGETLSSSRQEKMLVHPIRGMTLFAFLRLPLTATLAVRGSLFLADFPDHSACVFPSAAFLRAFPGFIA